MTRCLVEIRISGAGNKWHLVSGKTQEMQMQEKPSSALFFKYSGKGAIDFKALTEKGVTMKKEKKLKMSNKVFRIIMSSIMAILLIFL